MDGMCPVAIRMMLNFIYASYAGFASAGFFGPYYSLDVFLQWRLMVRRCWVFMCNNNDGLLAKVSGFRTRSLDGRWMKIL